MCNTHIDLPNVLRLHNMWVCGENGGIRADLRGANLYRALLRGANLYRALLNGADLRGANLDGADLRGANLDGADLRGADLRGANLDGADLDGVDLRNAGLYRALLRGANLYRADLRSADLCQADLYDTNLDKADLCDTVLDQRRNCPNAETALLAAGIPIHNGIAYGWRTRHSRYTGNTLYIPGRYTASVFSTCATTSCHPGIYFASRTWLNNEYDNVEVVPCATWVVCVVAAGDKFRTKELWVFKKADERWEGVR